MAFRVDGVRVSLHRNTYEKGKKDQKTYLKAWHAPPVESLGPCRHLQPAELLQPPPPPRTRPFRVGWQAACWTRGPCKYHTWSLPSRQPTAPCTRCAAGPTPRGSGSAAAAPCRTQIPGPVSAVEPQPPNTAKLPGSISFQFAPRSPWDPPPPSPPLSSSTLK